MYLLHKGAGRLERTMKTKYKQLKEKQQTVEVQMK